jgi:glutamine---fructose-6-phosphate transaminase (isomerizing)
VSADPPRLARDIENQAASLQRALTYHAAAGHDSLVKAGRLLGAVRRCMIIGIGASLNASIPLEMLLCRHGFDATAVEAGEWLHFRPGPFRNTAFVLISRSGESIEIVKAIEAIGGRAPLIGVTNVPASRLGRTADVVLDLHSLLDEMVAVQTYSATLATLHLLGMAALDRLDAGHRELEPLVPALADLIGRQLAELAAWDAFLQPNSTVYALGRGYGSGSATQASLLFHEVAKAYAVSMPVASFRHGPIEGVDTRFRALVLAPQGPTQALNVALAADIQRFGGQVRVIGPRLPEATIVPWIETPELDAPLAPLFDVVPLQCAALRLAQLRGIRIGSFRFTPPVALDEAAFPRRSRDWKALRV